MDKIKYDKENIRMEKANQVRKKIMPNTISKTFFFFLWLHSLHCFEHKLE